MSEREPIYFATYEAGNRRGTYCTRCRLEFSRGEERAHEVTFPAQHPKRAAPEVKRRGRAKLAAFFSAALLALLPASAWADAFAINSGALTLIIIGIDKHVVGTTFNASGPGVSLALLSGQGASPGCQPCVAGLPFTTTEQNGTTITGTMTIQGVASPIGKSQWFFDAPPILLPSVVSPGGFAASVPFTMGFGTQINGAPESVVGLGTASFTFTPDVLFPTTRWQLESGVYTITPEPTTGWLVLTGVLLVSAVGIRREYRRGGAGRRRRWLPGACDAPRSRS